MKIPIPSFTRFDTFARCPRQYAEDVISGPTPSTVAMERGSHLHNAFEAAAKLRLAHPDWEWDTCVTRIKEAPPEGVLSQNELESYLSRALPILKGLTPVVGGVEAWFDAVGPACGLPPLPVRGKIDLISATVWDCSEQARPYAILKEAGVVDYKTISGERRIKTSWEARRSMQLRIYCLATGLRRAGFVYLPPKDEARAIFVEFTDELLEQAHRWIRITSDVMLSCWSRFAGKEVTWGDEIQPIGDWTAWPLSHSDNMLCSAKWCKHFDNCLGAKSAERNA